MLSAVSREGRLAGEPRTGFWGRLFSGYAETAGRPSQEQFRSSAGMERARTVAFEDGKLFTLEVSDKCRIDCTAGMVWVTFQDRRCDYILGAGESLVLRKKGKVLISGGGRRDGVVEILGE